jgi:hypothetical protein
MSEANEALVRRHPTRRTWPRSWPVGLAWTLWAMAVLGLAVAALLDQLLRQAGRPDLLILTPTAIAPVLGAVSVATVGAVLASRRPRHPVSWLLLGFGLSLSAAGASAAYTNYGVANPGAPGAGMVALYTPAAIVIAMACNGFVLVLTPTGMLPSPRWRWWAAVTAATPVALLLVVTFAPRPTARPAEAVHSPLDLQALDGALLVAYQAAFAVAITAVVVAAASLVIRFRRARGIERQQLRWVAFATVIVSLLSVVNLIALALGAYTLAPLVGGLNPPILSAAIGAAILRYRLYDLDRIISRTVAYGVLTLLLGLGYAGVVLGLGRMLPQSSSMVVAIATVAVAAVFQPARRRIQRVVDRRFNRRRHDAGQMIEAFGDRLRDHVDLDTLTAELMVVVDETMQPTLASLWMWPQSASKRPMGEAGPRSSPLPRRGARPRVLS